MSTDVKRSLTTIPTLTVTESLTASPILLDTPANGGVRIQDGGAEIAEFFDSSNSRGFRLTVTAAGDQTLAATAGGLILTGSAVSVYLTSNGGQPHIGRNGVGDLLFGATAVNSATIIIAPDDVGSYGALRAGTVERFRWGSGAAPRTKLGDSTSYGNVSGLGVANTTAVGNIDTLEDNLITYSLPSDSLSATSKGVRITAWGTFANNANAKTLKLYFGAVILTNALVASVGANWYIEAFVFRTGLDTQDYVAKLATIGAAGVSVTDIELGSLTQDDGAAITIKCTGEAVTTNDIVQEGLVVEFFN